MRLLASLFGLYVLFALAGCANGPASEAVRKAQNESKAGPISKWHLSSAPWAASTQLMRDRAYAFCMSRHPNDIGCLNWSDVSLIVAHGVEGYFADQRKKPDPDDPRSDMLVRHPQIFTDARALCFSSYEDGGSGDVRMLGPCLTSAVGGDYFGTLPVP